MSEPEEKLTDHQKGVIRKELVTFAGQLLGIPYEYGAEWVDFSTLPLTVDCSEAIEGIYKSRGLRMPDGSQNQFNFTLSVPIERSQPGDLAFFGRGGNPANVYHVGMIYDSNSIIEARGFDPYAKFETGKTILRPISAWVAYKNFCGVRAHPKLA
jgi:cell wall-associated NlpC family hydrolase